MPRAPRPRDIDREAQAREILRRLLQGTQRLALRQLCALRAAACLRARQGRDRPLLLVQALDKEERAMTKRKARQPETASLAAISSEDARRYRAEEAIRTLMRASEHMKDKGLMRDVKKLAKAQAEALNKVGKP